MNVGELIEKLSKYPKNLPVLHSIQEGYGLLVNDIYCIEKDEEEVAVGLFHSVTGTYCYIDKDTVKLN